MGLLYGTNFEGIGLLSRRSMTRHLKQLNKQVKKLASKNPKEIRQREVKKELRVVINRIWGWKRRKLKEQKRKLAGKCLKQLIKDCSKYKQKEVINRSRGWREWDGTKTSTVVEALESWGARKQTDKGYYRLIERRKEVWINKREEQ